MVLISSSTSLPLSSVNMLMGGRPSRFNIQRDGLEGNVWATDKVIKGQGKQVIHIPECIEDGQYLLRAEMIALHGARTPGGAQFYVSYNRLCHRLSLDTQELTEGFNFRRWSVLR